MPFCCYLSDVFFSFQGCQTRRLKYDCEDQMRIMWSRKSANQHNITFTRITDTGIRRVGQKLKVTRLWQPCKSALLSSTEKKFFLVVHCTVWDGKGPKMFGELTLKSSFQSKS